MGGSIPHSQPRVNRRAGQTGLCDFPHVSSVKNGTEEARKANASGRSALRLGQLLVQLTDVDPPEDVDGLTRSYELSTWLVLLELEAGWEFNRNDHWFLRTALSSAITLAANSDISPDFEPERPRVQRAFSNLLAARVDQTLEQHVRIPLITIAIGYEF